MANVKIAEHRHPQDLESVKHKKPGTPARRLRMNDKPISCPYCENINFYLRPKYDSIYTECAHCAATGPKIYICADIEPEQKPDIEASNDN